MFTLNALPLSKRILLHSIAVVLFTATLLHVTFLTLYNAPESALRNGFSAPMRFYANSAFSQGWSLFAPNPAASNDHVLARAAAGDGRFSPWQDVTEFYLDDSRRFALTPHRRAAEALAHSASAIIGGRHYDDNLAMHVLLRTSAALINRRIPNHTFTMLQIKIERRKIIVPANRFRITGDPSFVDLGLSPFPKFVRF